MPRQKKDGYPVTVRMDRQVYDRLNNYCDRAGQSRTLAIERAVQQYIDEYDRKNPVELQEQNL